MSYRSYLHGLDKDGNPVNNHDAASWRPSKKEEKPKKEEKSKEKKK